MKLAMAIAGALLLALCHSGVAQARDQLGQRDEVVIDPQRAYIFFRATQPMSVRLLREVDAAERAAWEEERQAAFPRAREENERAIAEWDRLVIPCRNDRGRTDSCRYREPRPELLTYDQFTIRPAELDNFVLVMGGRRFTRTETENTYFIAVEPGTYAIYGHVNPLPSGSIGVCLCMGSVKFEARAGEIVDIGQLTFPRVDHGRGQTASLPAGRLAWMSIEPPSDSMSRPDRLAGLNVVRAELRAAGKVPNYFALEIDRMPAMPGILAYERDRVIDVQGQDAGEVGWR